MVKTKKIKVHVGVGGFYYVKTGITVNLNMMLSLSTTILNFLL